ncbi:UNVERIFIED_CONTAM: hypothetical protein Sangu_2601800 [Sesamum angustifolium]|uniref:Uncharacterized protein n=1 Tax=Sesamum angustifolium TaxID=2727405 RepID=A0AAW2J5U2_9LAMI
MAFMDVGWNRVPSLGCSCNWTGMGCSCWVAKHMEVLGWTGLNIFGLRKWDGLHGGRLGLLWLIGFMDPTGLSVWAGRNGSQASPAGPKLLSALYWVTRPAAPLDFG